ncbi:MAG: toll/interleukin-1 receptor domain-containing protein [Chthoniobacter sp.]|nr:toll/interleukin-1 receptor domain-containing protein [Chthoniobacter sp.]
MAQNGFPKSVEDVVATLADLFRHQGQSDVVDLLESASARIEETNYDNWNGGTYTYELMLDVPVPVFAAIEPKLAEIEKAISAKLAAISRGYSNDHLESITITPLTSKSASIGPKAKPPDSETKHLWIVGFFRLFLSHVSAHKVAVAELKKELKAWGISAFIAHEDITPSLEWQNEIELALRSMHALAALLTADFHQSNWTDQEVGFALGRGSLVVPVRLGLDPYGFIGKVQGLSGSLEQPSRIAHLLFDILLSHPATHRHMRSGLAYAFGESRSYSRAISLSKIIATVTDFSDEEKAIIQRACKDNDQVYGATGVVGRVCAAIGVPKPTAAIEIDDIPF